MLERGGFALVMARPAEEGAPGDALGELLAAECGRLWVLYATPGADLERLAGAAGLAGLVCDRDRVRLPRAHIRLSLERGTLVGVADLHGGLTFLAVYAPGQGAALSARLVAIYAFLEPRLQALADYLRFDVRCFGEKERLFCPAEREPV